MMNRRKKFDALAMLMVAGMACVMVVSPACEKKKPPPPAPVRDTAPPPPPPPSTVHLASILSGMSLDARVQVADDAQVLDERLGRAALEFAQSLVRGDMSDINARLGRVSKRTLEDLANTGEWDEAVADIEIVRIVYISDVEPGTTTDAPAMPETPELTAESLRDELLKAIREDPASLNQGALASLAGDFEPEQLQMAQAMFGPELMGQLMQMQNKLLANPANAEAVIQEMYDSGLLAQLANSLGGMMEQMQDSMAEMASVFGGNDGSAVTYAIQTPGEAYLLRFSIGRAGSEFVFNGIESIADVRARASDFDGESGELTLAAGGLPTLPVDFGGGRNLPPPSTSSGDTPEDAPGGPTKRTPGGPITIPGS